MIANGLRRLLQRGPGAGPVVSTISGVSERPERRHYHNSGRKHTQHTQGKRASPAARHSAGGKTEVLEFAKVFPDVVRDLTETGRHLDIPAATKRFAKVLQYNMTGGKKNRGLAVVLALKLLADGDLTPHSQELAHTMGWCVEMLHMSVAMTQDTLNDGRERRGRPCWHLAAGSPQMACNDAALMQTGLYQLLRMYFRSRNYYVDALELFHDVSHKATMGLVMDAETRGDKTLQQFTMDRYQAITKYKTAYLSFQTPISLALYMAGIRDQELHRQAKTILMEMGQFYQVLNDYLDCFGDANVTGRVGTDIEDGKCTWLAVVALQRATKGQRLLLQECYGSANPEQVAAVKQLYVELGLLTTYKTNEEQSYDLLCTQIQQISRGLPHKLFFTILDQIYVKPN